MKLEKHPRISIDPNICSGKPVITGTRIMVHQILGALASGQTKEELLAEYPSITMVDIHATLAFATELCDLQNIS